MMSCSRRLTTLASFRPLAVRAYSSTVPRLSENRIQANEPVVKPNAELTDRHVVWDGLMEEDPVKAERIRSLQAPNRATTWAASQQPREQAMVGPRFEQTIMETQVGYLF